jgi:hypothetical protein
LEVVIRVGLDQMVTIEVVKCSLIDLLVKSKCSGAWFKLYLSVAALSIGLVAAYFVYRFYKRRDISGNRRNQVKLVLLVLFASVLIVVALVPKNHTLYHYARYAPAEATEIDLGPGYNENGTLHLVVANEGDIYLGGAINVTDFQIKYGPPNIDPVSYSTLKAKNDSWTVGDGNRCFNEKMEDEYGDNQQILESGERITCSTGVKFPDALEVVEIVLIAKDFDYRTTEYCSVKSEDAKSC